MCGDRIGAERLHAMGLVNRVAEAGSALDTALALAEQLNARAPNALASIKELLNDAPHQALHHQLAQEREDRMDPAARKLVAQWPAMQKAYAGDEYVVKIRDKEIRTALTTKSLSGTTIRKVCLPQYECHGEVLKWLMLDNVPGSYPYTADTF